MDFVVWYDGQFLSVACVTTIDGHAGTAPARHAADESLDALLGDKISFLLQSIDQLLAVVGGRMSGSHSLSKLIPQLFNRAQIGRDGWPR